MENRKIESIIEDEGTEEEYLEFLAYDSEEELDQEVIDMLEDEFLKNVGAAVCKAIDEKYPICTFKIMGEEIEVTMDDEDLKKLMQWSA